MTASPHSHAAPPHLPSSLNSRLQTKAPPVISTITTASSVPFLARMSQSVQFTVIYLRAEWAIFWLTTFVKICMMPLYRSTDFEVHRNWLAITYSLPIQHWYTEHTSQWTLDYPPLFAWFQYALAQIAQLVDPEMLRVENLNYASEATVLFLRLSVIVTDLLLFYAIHTFARARAPWLPSDHKQSRTTLLFLSFCNPGLLMVDRNTAAHTATAAADDGCVPSASALTASTRLRCSDIHFQYNGFLLGLFILSLACMNQGRELLGAALFSVLLNLKHIFLYVSPVYFVYLLWHYCMQQTSVAYEGWEQFDRSGRQKRRLSLPNLLKLSAVVTAVFTVSFLPFALHHQLLNIKDRLFPFRRGLSHAYWAPNVWALYNAADLLLAAVLKQFMGWRPAGGAALTGGLVAEIEPQVLPSITPAVTFVLSLAAMLPALWKLSRAPHPSVFMSSLLYCSLCSFMLGWHVHEKAVLMVLLPLALLACDRVADASMFLLLATVGHYSLFPLLFPPSLTPLKVVLTVLYTTLAYTVLFEYHYEQQHKRRIRFQGFFSRAEAAYLLGFVPLAVVSGCVVPWIGGGRYAFLPLLLTSVYCSCGMMYGWWLCWLANDHRCRMLDSYEQE